MEVIGIIILLVVGFVILGGLGIILNILGFIWNLLFSGFTSVIGCLFWVFIIVVILAGLVA